MSSIHHKSVPADFLALPTRSGAIPNPAGTHALFNLSTYSFHTHRSEGGVHVLELGNGKSYPLSQDAQSSGHSWTGFGSEILWQKRVNSSTEFWIGDAISNESPYQAGRIDGQISILKITRLNDDAFAVICLGPKGLVTKSSTFSTGQEYSSLPVRTFFDDSPTRKVLWYLKFEADRSRTKLQFGLSWKIIDILANTGLDFVPFSGVVPTGPMNCDASRYGIVFVGTTRELSKYQNRIWTSELFFIPMSQLQSSKDQTSIFPQRIIVEDFSGAVSLPIISANGSVAFLRNEDQAKVTSKNHIFFVNMADKSAPKEILLHSSIENQDPWPLNPEMLTWSNIETKLLISAADTGRQRTFEISVCTSLVSKNYNSVPMPLDVGDGSILSVYPYSRSPSDHRLLVSKTSFVQNSVFLVVDPSSNSLEVLSALTNCKDLGLKRAQVSEIWFEGHGNYQVHSWIIKPSYFSEGEKYPLALFIHGGPHSSWQDVWSTRWNPVLFAEQGYVVACPDFTGSIGYNEDFKEAAIREMGGRPYHDLEKCFQYIEQHISFADTSNAVALGGSYGGYLIYWLAGQSFALRFKALVAHAGIFNIPSLYASDVPDIWKVLFGGYDSDPSQIIEIFKKWDPAQFGHKWQTPILITHGELDRRCPSTMSIAAFTMAQMKGVESKFLSFADERHFILKPENSLRWHEVVISWINKYIK